MKVPSASVWRLRAAIIAIAALPLSVHAQDSTHHRTAQSGDPIDTNRIGVMSFAVVRQRLVLLGYRDISVVSSERGLVTTNARKNSRSVAVRLDPQTGVVTEYKGIFERRPEGVMLRVPNGKYIRPDTGVLRRVYPRD